MGFMDFLRGNRKQRDRVIMVPVYSKAIGDDAWISTTAEDKYTLAGKCMNVPVFAESVEYISDMIASMPVKLYHRVDNKIVEKTDDKRIILLNVDTKSGMSGYQFKKRMIKDYLLYGGGYAAIRKYDGEIDGLFYVTNNNVNISKQEERLYYRSYKFCIGAVEYEPFQFLKVLRDSTNGVSGKGMLTEYSQILHMLYHTLKYTTGDVCSGGLGKQLLSTEANMSKEIRDELEAKIQEGMAKISNNEMLNYGVALFDVKSIPLEDGYIKQDITERIKIVEKSVRSLFRIKDDFYETFREAIFPIIKAFEAALNMDLLTTKEQSEYFFEVDTSEVLKANIKDRYAVHKTAIEAGIKTINEVRKDENLEEIEGLDWTKVDLGTAVYKGNQIHVVNTGETISLTSKSPVEGGEKNDTAGEE